MSISSQQRTTTRTRPRIGVALGSGGARGWAHVGVLRRLQELNVPIDCVAGTSIGSIMAAAFAAHRLDVLENLTYQLDWRRVAQLLLEANFPRTGLLTGKRIQQLLQELIGVQTIEELHLPFAAVAANLQTGQQVVFSRGSIVDAIRASIAIPGIFAPAQLDGQTLVDGGTLNPLPIDVVESLGADIVIAVDVNLQNGDRLPPASMLNPPVNPAATHDVAEILAHIGKPLPLHGAVADAMQRWVRRESTGLSIFDVITRSARISENQITQNRLQLHPPTLLIQPRVGNIETLEFHHAIPAIAAGRIATDACVDQIRKLVDG